MNTKQIAMPALIMIACHSAFAADAKKPLEPYQENPEVASRTYFQNYKDLALAACIAQAYSGESKAAADAGATASGLDSTWTSYDVENGSDEIYKLVNQYLKRQYNSVQGPEIKLDLMKCLDLYHSKELEILAKRVVLNPARSYRKDHPKIK